MNMPPMHDWLANDILIREAEEALGVTADRPADAKSKATP